MSSNLPLGVIEMKQTARFSFTSINSSHAYDTRRRQMTPSTLPQNRIAFLAVSPPSLQNGKQLSLQNKHEIILLKQSVLLDESACLLFLIVQAFFVSLHPASFSTCAGCMPGLQTSLCVFPALATCHASLSDSLPHYPGHLTVFPTPLHYNPSPNWPVL